ncbi:MAG: lysylphosphatidylglycerol synthase transmembrane domain-containing protein [Clostridia bacterium]
MKKIVLNSVIIIITGIALVVLVFFTDGVQSLFELIVRTNYYWLFGAFLCNVLFWVFGALTVGMLKRGIIGKKKDPGQNFKIVMVGQFFSSITPFQTGGQPAQVYMLSKMGVNAGTGSSIIILKSVLFQTVLFVYCMILYITNRQFLILNIPNFNLLFIIGVTANLSLIGLYSLFLFKSDMASKAVAVFFQLLHFFKIMKEPQEKFMEVQESLQAFRDGLGVLVRRFWYIVGAYAMQILQQAFLFLVPVLMIKALEGVFFFSWELFVSTAMVVMIASMVPTPGTSGGSEGLSLLFIAPFFFNSPKMSVVLIWRILTYYSNIIFGGVFCLMVKEKPLVSGQTSEERLEI